MDILDNREKIIETDKSGMLKVALDMPQLFQQAQELSRKIKLPKMKTIKQMVISGMGGSAIAGDIIAGLFLNKLRIPIYVNRSYELPAFVGRETLFFALSYSGNTEETLKALKEAEERSASIIAVTSGGELKELAEKSRYPLYHIPSGYQPRAALPFLLVPLLSSLEKTGLISDLEKELEEAVLLLQKLKENYGPDRPTRTSPLKQLAKKLSARIPIIFATSQTAAAGLRLKTQFNENSKLTAFLSVFPELNHNEIVNLFALKREGHNFCLLCLRDERDSERIKKRIEITKSLVGTQTGGMNEIWSQGKSDLARIMSLIYFGDVLSVYVAVLRGVDPTPVEAVFRLKKELSR